MTPARVERGLVWPVLSAVLVAGAFATMALLRRWVCDDAHINFRVVEMLAAGYGPVFNPGERVEVATSTLWLALLTGWRMLGGDPAVGSVVLGIAFAVAAVATLALPRELAGHPRMVPAGAVIFAALPVAWDFASSGLESGLVLFWIATAWRASWGVYAARTRRPAARALLLAWIGLGAIVRPEASVVVIALLVSALAPGVLLESTWRARARRLALDLIPALALPALVHVARCGYYGSLASNPSVAKGLGAADLPGGIAYVADLLGTYLLLTPLVALGVAAVAARTRSPGARGPDQRSARAGLSPDLAVAVAGLAWAFVVVKVGGDFMHGRMLLPPLFAMLLPVGTLALPEREAPAAARIAFLVAGATIAAWAAFAASSLRPPAPVGEPQGVVDERAFYVSAAGMPNPVTAADFAESDYAGYGIDLQAGAERLCAAGACTPGVALGARDDELGARRPVAAWIHRDIVLVAPAYTLGLVGSYAGPRVFVFDALGLADPIAARLPELEDGRVGHRRRSTHAWYFARHAAPSERDTDDVRTLRRALTCGALAELHEATTAPLTPGLFVRNVLRAPRLSRLQIPRDAEDAFLRFCDGTPG